MAHPFPVSLMINTVRGPLPLTLERSPIPLPQGPGETSPPLHYGPYLSSVASCLAQDDHRPLREALSAHLQRPVALEDICAVEIISKKHGACYHVLQVRTTLPEGVCSLAVDVAVTGHQKSAMEREFQTVRKLHGGFHRPFLPRFYLMGEARYRFGEENPIPLGVLVAEWFEDYHEFHLSGPQEGRVPRIRLWESDEEGDFLDEAETRSLYHQASFILTACFDENSFRQIQPWHHAAGDFVVHRDAAGIRVRLIAARDYRCLCASAFDSEDRWVPILHFLFNLSVRMRLDRLDGRGPLAWAPPDSLSGVLSGFLEAWREKTSTNSILHAAEDVLEVTRQLNREDWISFGECVIEDCMVESDENTFIRERLHEHVVSLAETIRKAI